VRASCHRTQAYPLHRGVPQPPPPRAPPRFLDTHSPFCLVAVGVQGAGKSHTLGVVAEAVLLGAPDPDPDNLGAAHPGHLSTVCRLGAPMCALVFHYDTDPLSQCELLGLGAPSPLLTGMGPVPHVPQDKVIVLTSPSFYRQRRATYPAYRTVPLLFDWDRLSAEDVRVGVSWVSLVSWVSWWVCGWLETSMELPSFKLCVVLLPRS
jgi:hypothetical protein